MGGQRGAMVGGGVWTLFRFAVVSLVVARLAPQDPVFHLSLLWVGAPSLLMVGLLAGSAFVPGAQRYYLPPLRIGTLLAAITDTVVALTGSYVPVAERVGTASEPIGRLVLAIVYGVLAVDLLILAALISYRPMSEGGSSRRDDNRPGYHPTEVEDE